MSRTAWQPERIAWVAGVIEGEGCIRSHKTRSSWVTDATYAYPAVFVSMTDEDVVRRLQEWTGLGRVQGPYTTKTRPNAKPVWHWAVTRQDAALTLIAAIWPYLGDRRKAKVREVLAAYRKGTKDVAHRVAASAA